MMNKGCIRFLFLFAFLIPTFAFAEQISGVVVSVHDGDTITVLDNSKVQHKIRLAGIDAPELGQPFGQASHKHLAGMIAGKAVTVEWRKRDRYGRKVGKVMQGEDVCLIQIRNGMAWHFKRYEREQIPEDRRAYAQAENEARAEHVGLWQNKRPVTPWDWRKLQRQD